MEANRNVILRTENLTKCFGALRACDEVTLGVYDGEIHAIIGPNGAGKSTLMDLIVNRTPATSGNVYFHEQDITRVPPYDVVKRGICKCFQTSMLFMKQTCVENVRIALIVRHKKVFDMLPKPDRYLREESLEYLCMVGIGHLADETAGFLSYGDQRRLEIAITLALQPELLMLDEPTSGVSQQEGDEIMKMIVGLVKKNKITVIFIEHNMDFIFSYADRISVMNHGMLIATDTPQNIRDNAFVQQAYIGGGIE